MNHTLGCSFQESEVLDIIQNRIKEVVKVKRGWSFEIFNNGDSKIIIIKFLNKDRPIEYIIDLNSFYQTLAPTIQEIEFLTIDEVSDFVYEELMANIYSQFQENLLIELKTLYNYNNERT